MVGNRIGDQGLFSSLALDAQGKPHVSSYDENLRHLMHAWRYVGGTWAVETAHATDGWYTWLALDAQGNPRVCYHGNRDLKYADRGMH